MYEPDFSCDDLRFRQARERLIEQLMQEINSDSQFASYDGRRVLDVMKNVSRHVFMDPETWHLSYCNQALDIGMGQTISQPYIVAVMTMVLGTIQGKKVLEIGTGCGYQSAVLAESGARVFSIEIIPEMANRAQSALQRSGYHDVQIRIGNGFHGWSEEAPFDAIVVTAAPDQVPCSLLDQLSVGGRMVVPVGPAHGIQYLECIKRLQNSFQQERLLAVRFVPMTGQVR